MMEILIISGLSGAGKSSAATYLEDMGYYTVDNVPADIILKFAAFCAQSDGRYDRVALVSDIRSGDGNFAGLLDAMERLRQGGDVCRLLFVTADLETIIKRYKETRRLHPLMKDGSSLSDAIARERRLLDPVRTRANAIIDTTNLSTGKLRGMLIDLAAGGRRERSMHVRVMSFGFKYGLPLDADLVFDVRFLPNPYYIPELRNMTGMDEPVRSFVFQYQQTKDFAAKIEDLLAFLLPNFVDEGKTDVVIAVGCTGGKHRSVCLARELSEFVSKKGYATTLSHRDMGRR